MDSGPHPPHLLYTGLASFTPHDLTLGQAFSNICRNGYRIIAVEAAFQVFARSINCYNTRLRRSKKWVNLNFLFFEICIINPVGLFWHWLVKSTWTLFQIDPITFKLCHIVELDMCISVYFETFGRDLFCQISNDWNLFKIWFIKFMHAYLIWKVYLFSSLNH